jgi:hypothetical protein
VRLLGLLVLTAIMVALCYWCTTLAGLLPRAVGWFGVVFFGLGFIMIPVKLVTSGPQVMINDEGIEARRLGVGLIPWQDIDSLSLASVNRTRFLNIWVTDPEKYISILPKWKRAVALIQQKMGFSVLTLTFSGLSPGIDEVWTYLKDRDFYGKKEGTG